MLLHDEDEDDEEEEAAAVLVDQTIRQQLCKHGQGPDCPQCSSSR